MERPLRAHADVNKLDPSDASAHAWYRFVLSYPPHLVRHYLGDFGIMPGQCVLDPFCGTGTTIVECRKNGIDSIGIEANPMGALACRVKTDWSITPSEMVLEAEDIANRTVARLKSDGIPDVEVLISSGQKANLLLRELPAPAMKLLLTDSISPRPLHKALVLLEVMAKHLRHEFSGYGQVALAKTLVFTSSNLHFGPEVGIGKIKADAPVVAPWLAAMRQISQDIQLLSKLPRTKATLIHADARVAVRGLEPGSIDAVITSPPYPNEKDYTRTTRLESVLLGLISNKHELRALKQHLVRSNTRNVFIADVDDAWVAGHPEIERIATAIESRRVELGKTSGFEKMYHRVTRHYFGGMTRHLAELRPALKPGAMLAYVVGDQASYLRVMIRTGDILADLARGLGYEVVRKDLFRTRLATATKEQLREEALILRWPK